MVVEVINPTQPSQSDSSAHTDVNDSLLGRRLAGMPVLPELQLLRRDLFVVKNNHHNTLQHREDIPYQYTQQANAWCPHCPSHPVHPCNGQGQLSVIVDVLLLGKLRQARQGT